MKTLKALTAGLLVGLVLIESIFAGLSILLPESWLAFESGRVFIPAWPLKPVPALVWLLGALGAGAMATAVRGHPAAGLACGVLLGGSAFLLTNLVLPGTNSPLLAAALPLAGAAAGSLLARRLDGAVSSGKQTV